TPLRLCWHTPLPSETATLSLHDALPIYLDEVGRRLVGVGERRGVHTRAYTHWDRKADILARDCRVAVRQRRARCRPDGRDTRVKIGKHTSELQSRENLVCRLLLEKKKRA